MKKMENKEMAENKETNKEQQASYSNTRRQILSKDSSFSVQEAYKTLRTNVRFFLQNKGCKCLSITSAVAGEGKSITLLNLAISVAEDGHRVLLIDADLRRPALARLMMEKAAPGLSNVLAGLAAVEEAIRPEMYPNLDVMFSGDVPPNPSELLGSDKMKEMLEAMSKKYDYILVDTPPVNVVSDASIVTNLLDGVLLLVRQGSSRRDAIKRAVANLELTGIKPIGFVLNGVDLESKKGYGYYE